MKAIIVEITFLSFRYYGKQEMKDFMGKQTELEREKLKLKIQELQEK